MTQLNKRGRFLTLEGVDGAGKSTHVDWLVVRLRSMGLKVLSTREPGGTPVGEKLRDMLLSDSMHLDTETLLMFASRAEHLHKVVLPALSAGTWVVCDRFTDATFAYQGGGRELGCARVAVLEQWVHPQFQPDRTWLFDVPLEVARERLDRSRSKDRFEKEADAFFERTRAVYLDRAQSNPQRMMRVDATQTIAEIRAFLDQDLQRLYAQSLDTP